LTQQSLSKPSGSRTTASSSVWICVEHGTTRDFRQLAVVVGLWKFAADEADPATPENLTIEKQEFRHDFFTH